jgi:cell division protein FtsB
MKNPLKKTIEKNPLLKFLSNKYVLVLLFFIVWMLFLDNYSYLDHRLLDKEINELEDNKKYYQDEIKKDQDNIKILKNPDQIERYAREKYYMKRDSEDIYLIEYEGEAKDSDKTDIPN